MWICNFMPNLVTIIMIFYSNKNVKVFHMFCFTLNSSQQIKSVAIYETTKVLFLYIYYKLSQQFLLYSWIKITCYFK